MREVIPRFLKNLEERNVEIRALSIIHRGETLLEQAWYPFTLDDLYPVYSVTKSFLSVLVGWQMEEGHLSLDDTWLSFFPAYEAVADPRFTEVTIRQMLTMTLGQETEIPIRREEEWIERVLAEPIVYPPGTRFLYNSHISNLLGLLVERLSGHSLMEEWQTRVFEPLGISDIYCETDRAGHALAGLGLHLHLRDVSRFGQALLAGGIWEDRRICPEGWLREAGKKQVDNAPAYPPENIENRVGYGYHFWRCSRGGFRCSGLYGQLCYIWPEEELVITAHSATDGNAALLSSLYDAMDAERAASAYEAQRNASAERTTMHKEGMLTDAKADCEKTVLTPQGNEESTLLASEGWQGVAEENPYGITVLSLTWEPPTEDKKKAEKTRSLHCRLTREGKTYSVLATYGCWKEQKDLFTGFSKHRLADLEDPRYHTAFQAPRLYAAYAWETDACLRVQIRAIDFSGRPEFTFRFFDGQVQMDFQNPNYLTDEENLEVLFKEKRRISE